MIRPNSKINKFISMVFFAIYVLLPNVAMAAEKTCDRTEQVRARYYDCFTCKIFESIFDGISGMIEASYSLISGGCINLIGAITGLWLVVKVAQLVSALTPKNPMEFLQELGGQVFKIILVSTILRSGPAFYFSYIATPIISGASDFAAAMAGTTCPTVPESSAATVMPPEIGVSISCMVNAMYSQVTEALVLGESLMCFSFVDPPALKIGGWLLELIGIPTIVIPDVGFLLTGLFVYVFAMAVMVAFPFYLIDSMFRIGIFGLLVPVMLVLWVFPITASYVGNIFILFKNAVGNFMFMSLVMSLGFSLINASLGGTSLDGTTTVSGISGLMEALDAQDLDAVEEILGMDTPRFILFIASFVYAFLMVSKGAEFTTHYIGGSFANGAVGFATMTASFAKNQAGKVADKAIVKPAKALAGSAAKGVARAGIRGFDKARASTGKAIGNTKVGKAMSSANKQVKSATQFASKMASKTMVGRAVKTGAKAVVAGAKEAKNSQSAGLRKWANSRVKV